MRNNPGFLFVAIRAASIAKVPDPHMGFTKGELPSHLDAIIVEAARASNIGAFPGIFR
ncbi:hypothetical protein D3C73_686710 [compost metagenome]